jgi:pyruvate,water dikinase
MNAVPLVEACDERAFGGKAVQLGAGIRAGLPVPGGFALAADLVEAVALGDEGAHAQLAEICAHLSGPLAVRSSAVGEDSATASFAGQHATFLNVCGIQAAIEAVEAVWRSASSESALAYRERVGADGPVLIGVAIQKLVAADVAGVMFTCNPVTGADELMVEASWGLGEAIVQGLVIPDRYRLGRGGDVLEHAAGFKTLAVRQQVDGGTRHEPGEGELVEEPCVAAAELRALNELAVLCDDVFGSGPHDIEWAFEAGALYLLQRRPITTKPAAAVPHV